jgi:hypothetical protein
MPLLQPGEELRGALQRLRACLGEEGRDARAFGIDARIHIGRDDPDSWRRQVEEFRALGVTHLAINTGRAGRAPHWHLDTLLRFKDLVHDA